jgi:hypothetical protein
VADVSGQFEQAGAHVYYYYDYGGWEYAEPPYTYYWADASAGPMPTGTGSNIGSEPTWYAGSGPNAIAIYGSLLNGYAPTVSDTGCSAYYSISAWSSTSTTVSANLYVSSNFSSYGYSCIIQFSMLNWAAYVLLEQAEPITATIHNGSATGPDITGTTQSVPLGVFPTIVAVPSCCAPTYSWSLPGHAVSVQWQDDAQSNAQQPAKVTALSNSALYWAFWDTSGSGAPVTATVSAGGAPATPSVAYSITQPQLTALSANESGVHIGADCPQDQGSLFMCLYSGGGPAGIGFNLPSNMPQDGAYELVQVLNSAVIENTASGGGKCKITTSGLDGLPSPGTHLTDNPDAPLSGYTEVNVTEAFSTFLMYAVAPNSNTDTWVPLAVVNWSWAGDAVLGSGGNWTLQGGSSPNVPAGQTISVSGVAAPAYPTWTQFANPQAQCVPE